MSSPVFTVFGRKLIDVENSFLVYLEGNGWTESKMHPGKSTLWMVEAREKNILTGHKGQTLRTQYMIQGQIPHT